MTAQERPIHVSLVATQDSLATPVNGFFEVLTAFELLAAFDQEIETTMPFEVEIVGPDDGPLRSATGLPIRVHRGVRDVDRTDIIIVPLMNVAAGEWARGRHPALVDWMTSQHAQGAMLCSACTGALLLAETGLLDGRRATTHWAFAPTFRRNFPHVELCLEESLVTAGERQELVMSGASASWHDLALYLIARHVSPAAAQAMTRFTLLQRHGEGQAPFMTFAPPMTHSDAVVLNLQEWLRSHHAVANPVEAMAKRSGLPSRTLERRFKAATGHSPISYVQHLRVEEAKRRLERTSAPIDEIGWTIGYEDGAAFRRLFKRVTRLTPAEYRRRFRITALDGEAPLTSAGSGAHILT